MAKPKHIDLTEDGVITQQALLAYAEGKLSDAERAQMDKLLRDDPFAQDALEGLRQAPNPAGINTVVTSINTALREKTGVRERKKKGIEIHWANYAYAAVVLGVLVGVGYVMIHVLSGEHKELAQNKSIPKATESTPVVEEKKKESPAPIDTTKPAAYKGSDSIAANGTYTATGSASGTVTYLTAPATGTIQEAKTIDQSSKQAETEKTKVDLSGETAAQLGVARNYFGAGDYVNAEKKYNEILASQPDNADALYFGGICAFYNGSKGLGESNFDKLSKTTQYTEGSKWYKASILIKKGKIEEAKPLLRDLINTNSYFKDRAVKQYEELFHK
jgi:tetratricopeptide (TPR) repeat protein